MGNGMTTSLIVNRLSIRDHHNQRLETTARGPTTGAGVVGGAAWSPTSRRILGQEEIDKQNDDNLTFMFEFRSLLNTRLQTLLTSLSNALASDLDIAMNASNLLWGNDRAAMSGNTIPTLQDAGGGRVTYNYMMGWMDNAAGVAATQYDDDGAAPAPPPRRVDPATGINWQFTNTGGAAVDAVGTTTLNSAVNAGVGAKVVDIMDITLGAASTFMYRGIDADVTIANGHNVMDDSFENSPLATQAVASRAKNLTEKVLYDSLSSIEFRSVLSSGLFKNIIVSASSSLPTGSQAQASLNLSYTGTDEGGELVINMDKFTAFYSS